MKTPLFLLALSLFTFSAAQAHYIWVETPHESGGTAEAYFGEFDRDARETSPGKLDGIGAIDAWTSETNGGGNNLDFKKTAKSFSAAVAQESRGVIQLQTEREVREGKKTVYYASALLPGTEPGMIPKNQTELAVYPVQLGKEAKIQALFRGEPAAKAELKVYAPNTWSKDLRTDEHGTVSFAVPWPGRYVIEVTRLEEKAGEFKGAAYNTLRHVATFSWENPGEAAA